MEKKDQNRRRCKKYRKSKRSLEELLLDSDDSLVSLPGVPENHEENVLEQSSSQESNDNLEQNDDVLVENNDIEESDNEEEHNLIYEEDVINAIFSSDSESNDEFLYPEGEDEEGAEAEPEEGRAEEENRAEGLQAGMNLNMPPEISKLKEWAIQKKIKLDALNMLLGILRERLLPSLPKCGKTFLGTTDAEYNIIPMEDCKGQNGSFVYFGIANALKSCVNTDLYEENLIFLQINIDGVSVTHSGTGDLWPITGKIHFDPDIYGVFPIAIFYGQSKPSCEPYLEEFTAEINSLQRDGMIISNRHFNIRIKCFICDTPARAFVKCCIGHGGMSACERCEVEGVSIERTTVYPSVEAQERTDASFRTRRQVEHHHRPSPLERIVPHVNMISSFILDFMHLCCLGMMKKLLEYWLTGNLNFRMGLREKEELSRRMNVFYSQIPSEFQRKSRSTKHYAKWKAVEFRFFLLYCGPIAMKKILRQELYNHFLLFHAACRILCCDVLCNRYSNRAKQYLTSFFVALKDYYGQKSQTLNAHNLIHMCDDVTSMNCSVTRITAFPFENYLGKLKKLIRTPYRVLSQLCRRLNEQEFFLKKATVPQLFTIINRKRGSVLAIKYNGVKITTSPPDNSVLLEDDSILIVDTILENPDGMKVEGRSWRKLKPIFTYPFNSGDHMNMWELENEPINEIKVVPLHLIKKKLIRLNISSRVNGRERVFAIPMLH